MNDGIVVQTARFRPCCLSINIISPVSIILTLYIRPPFTETKSASYTEPSLQFTNHSVLFILAKINRMFIILTMLESCPSAT